MVARWDANGWRRSVALEKEPCAACAEEMALRPTQETLDIVRAERTRLRDMLSAVITILQRQGGYMHPKDQQTLREAKAALASLMGL